MSTRKKFVFCLAIALLDLFLLLAALVGVEAAYRLRLYLISPALFAEYTSVPGFFIYDDAHYRFSEQYGYEYAPGLITAMVVNDGRSTACNSVGSKVDRFGNLGDNSGSYEDAKLKILVFGDSWMAVTVPRDGVFYTVPSVLQQRLERQLGREVHVVNFGRDGYGVLQMFDLAVDKIAEYKPDVVIFAFITDDLTRDRFWRTVGVFDGQRRVLTTTDPRSDPDLGRSADTQLLSATPGAEACSKAVGDPTLNSKLAREFLETYKSRRVTRPSIFGASSYLYSRWRYGDPFFRENQQKRPVGNPRHELHDFMDDQRFSENVKAINAMGIPYVVIHLAIYNEIRDGKEYVLGQPAQQADLLASLARVTRRPIHPTLGNIPLPVGDLSVINSSQGDYHPSLVGMEFYADLMARILGKEGYIHEGKRLLLPASNNRLTGAASN